jgi:hypothetical protein
MAHGEKVYEAVEKLAQTTRDSYETVVGHTVALGEQNVKFMRGYSRRAFASTCSRSRPTGR